MDVVMAARETGRFGSVDGGGMSIDAGDAQRIPAGRTRSTRTWKDDGRPSMLEDWSNLK